MPVAQCQYCDTHFPDFPRYCPNCNRPVLGATAIRFIGQGLVDLLRACTQTSPQLAKKKTTLYLKFCQKFLCDSELALINVKMYAGEMDERTLEAIEDVLSTHKQHTRNLETVLSIIGAQPELSAVAKRVGNLKTRLDTLLNVWLRHNFSGRPVPH